MRVVGLTKIRNEAHIIKDTLDTWSEVCDAIHVYDDASTDETPWICMSHRKVVEVLSSTMLDPNRERAEWYCRQAILQSARRFLAPEDWVVYFDGDEWLARFDKGVLKEPLVAVALRSFDSYITPEDQDLADFRKRRWVSAEWEFCPYFYRAGVLDGWHLPDQRNATLRVPLQWHQMPVVGDVRHWGKGVSVENFERKCRYYTEAFGPKYAAKWEARKGKAVHDDYCSDFGNKLVLWDDVISGKAETWNRSRDVLVR